MLTRELWREASGAEVGAYVETSAGGGCRILVVPHYKWALGVCRVEAVGFGWEAAEEESGGRQIFLVWISRRQDALVGRGGGRGMV